MTEDLFKTFGEIAEIIFSESEEFKIIPEVTPEELRSTLSKFDFKAPVLDSFKPNTTTAGLFYPSDVEEKKITGG